MKKLIFSDDFSIDGKPNPEKWIIETGGHGGGNNESQFYTDSLENAYVKDGALHIVAQKQDFENKNYTSAKMTTYGIKSFKYGRFEFVAKIPKGVGSWPAIWMLPNDFRENVSWPECGEIDIMEHIGRDQDVLHFTLHTGIYNSRYNTQYTEVVPTKDVSNKFIEYAMDWEEDRIEFFVDGKSVSLYTKGQSGKDTSIGGWPFNKEFFLILNLAVGGHLGGEIIDDDLPYHMEIKSIKVYEK